MIPVDGYTISELADAAGLSRRTVRFYVQQRLLPPPIGEGRGAHYDASHLERLKRIGELQAGGYSLEAIRRILEGKQAAAEPIPAEVRETAGKWSAELWTRVTIAEGVELHLDATRRQVEVGQLAEIRRAVVEILGRSQKSEHRSQKEN